MTKIYFLKKLDLLQILNLDKDNFYKKFTIKDLIARNVKNIDEYIQRFPDCVDEFTALKKLKIEKYASQIDRLLLTIKFPWFDGKKASEIPWFIGCISGKLYEDGLPHTRNNIIILPKRIDKDLFTTMFHEKIHIYQKIYKMHTQLYLSTFKKLSKRIDGIRVNPDTNEWIYKGFSCNYNENPRSITDVKEKDQNYEHPLERMAIYISTIYKN